MKQFFVSILVSTYNRLDLLKKCLDSIKTQDYPKNLLEIIVLDDASSDRTSLEIPKYLEEFKEHGFDNVQYFRNKENMGIVRGRWFLGTKISSKSEGALILDDDACLEADCLGVLAEYLLKHPMAGLVGPKVAYASNPAKTAHCANYVNLWTGRYSEKNSDKPMACDWIISLCFLIRASLLREIGGLYPGYYTTHEEVELGLRVQNKKYLVVYNPLAVVYHHENSNPQKRENLYYMYRNKILLIKRNFPFPNKIIALLLIISGGLPKYLLESISFHKKPVFCELKTIALAVWDGLTGREGKINP